MQIAIRSTTRRMQSLRVLAALALALLAFSGGSQCFGCFRAHHLQRASMAKSAEPQFREGDAAEELPDWLMTATGGVEGAKDVKVPEDETESFGVDMGWDYRVVSGVVFVVGLIAVGFISQ
mmetsp:Transcript_13036/g.23228  ORF Transcript_13036/g.23228 Transcript_13036/m.23228 type:complete len:121 (-) Transcript_13036:59-421(-)